MSLLEIVRNGINSKVEEKYILQFDNLIFIKDLNEYSTAIIKNKFKTINKDSSFEFADLRDSDSFFEKGFHSLVLYALGIKLFEWFNVFLKEKLSALPEINNSTVCPKEKYWFEYIWRLASFYHDVMTENEKKDTSTIIKKFMPCLTCADFTVEKFLNNCDDLKFKGIQYNIYGNYKRINTIIRLLSSITQTYKKKIINSYFRKRLAAAKLDHGIIAGYVFYNQLVKNYLEKDKRAAKSPDGSFSIGNLRYRPCHLLLFKFIADAIIAHNIWHYNNGSEQAYKLWGLEKLSPQNRLSLKKNPLAFMLGLLDTIEPVKYFCKDDNKIKPKEVLESIDIELSHEMNQQSIIISLTETIDVINFDNWFDNKLKDMMDWLDLTVEHIQGTKEIKITIPGLGTTPKQKNSFEEIKP